MKNQESVIYPEGIANGNFGPATKRMVICSQEKYASEILALFWLKTGNGMVGLKTRKVIKGIIAKSMKIQ